MESSIPLPPDLQGPPLTVSQIHNAFQYVEKEKIDLKERLTKQVKSKATCSASRLFELITKRIPILKWLPEYSISDLPGDAISGLTVSVMHIPQGTFAVVSIMTAKVVGIFSDHNTGNSSDNSTMIHMMDFSTSLQEPIIHNMTDHHYIPIEVVSIVCLAVGFWQMVFGVLQLGSLCVFLSDMLVSGFTTGAAIHVFTSQIKYIFGIKTKKYNGPFNLVYTYSDFLGKLNHINVVSIIVSVVCMTIMIFTNEVLKPKVQKFTKVPIPIELLTVIGGTMVAYFGNLAILYSVDVVGDIPTGLPEAVVPPLELFDDVLIDSFTIAIVSFTVTFSLARILAKKRKYTVNATQELYAQGVGNIFGSFFTCLPFSASLSRSLVQEAVGGVTQLASLISCGILLVILMFVGPLFESLPKCVLASIIIVALKGMFLQIFDFIKVWRISKTDGVIWITTFLGVILIDVDYGLLLGFLVSLFVLLFQNQKVTVKKIGKTSKSDLFLEFDKYSKTEEIEGMKLCQISGSIHFANCEQSSTFIDKVIDFEGIKENCNSFQTNGNELTNGCNLDSNKNIQIQEKGNETPIKSIVIDFSGLSFIDNSGSKMLIQYSQKLRSYEVELCLSGLSESVFSFFAACNFFEDFPQENVFHALRDAVTMIQERQFCSRV